MTLDEKLAVIAGNLRECETAGGNVSDVALGNIYELVRIVDNSADDDSAVDIAGLVIPEWRACLFAQFCRLYKKYCYDGKSPFQNPETAEKPDSVAMPEINRLDEALRVLAQIGVSLTAEYGDSFSSCCEDVQYGNCRYVLMPYSDPAEGRLRSFDKLRLRYGLKIHCKIYVVDNDGNEYGYQLCGLGIADKTIFAPVGIMIAADVGFPPMEYFRGIEIFGTRIRSAEFEDDGDSHKVCADIDISGLDDNSISGLLMYLGMAKDLTIDGVYAEIHNRSKGFDNGLH